MFLKAWEISKRSLTISICSKISSRHFYLLTLFIILYNENMNQVKYQIMSQKVAYVEGLPLHFLKNVEITSKNGGGDRNFAGTYFPIPYGKHYYHIILDYLSGYLFLKQYFPDLKPIFIKTGIKKEKSGTFRACDDLAEIFNAEIIDVREDNYIFEKIIVLNSDVHVIPKEYYATLETFISEESELYVNFIQEAIPLMSEYIMPLAKLDGSQNNIWISRKIGSRKMQSTNFEEEKTKRVHHDLYNEHLEEEIKKISWKVYDLEDMSFYDQLNIFYNANKIAGFEGTCLLNTIFSNAPILAIKTNKNYTFNFIGKILFNKYNIEILDITQDSPEIGFQKILTHLQI